jgi:N-acetylglucosamine-6-sulfatase
VQRLDSAGVLENTYIFYTTDNGYHISQHRMHPGKECGFETDINVPMIVRGPGVPAGRRQRAVSSHTDIAPTILSLAGIPLKEAFDGTPMPLRDHAKLRHEHVGIEFWGLGIPEGRYGYRGKYMFGDGVGNAYVNNTYKGLRIESAAVSLYYSVWCTGERELYDMKVWNTCWNCPSPILAPILTLHVPQVDEGQLNNLLGASSSVEGDTTMTIMGRNLGAVAARLDALMMVIKSCKGETCRYPWRSIHPQEDVNSLEEALDPTFDAFYNEQRKVSFTECKLGYIKEFEGPQDVLAFGDAKHEGSKLDEHVGQEPLVLGHDWSLLT